MRYMPTLRTPVLGSRVITPGSVMYGPPSSGQHTGTGNCARSTSWARITVSWQGGRPPAALGGNFPSSASCGNMASLPSSVSGTFRLRRVASRSPISSRHSTPSARAIRLAEPNTFTATGWRARAPDARVGCVNKSAGPPPADFMHRSAISVISLSTATGCATRASSPRASMAPRKSRRLSSGMVDGADPAGEELVADVRESHAPQAPRQRLRRGKVAHRLWQVRIGVSMFRHRATDHRKQAPKVQQVERAQRCEARCRELEYHKAGAGTEYPIRFLEPSVQIREIPHSESDHGAVEPGVGKREREHVGADGTGACRLAPPQRQHREHEIRRDHGAAERALSDECRRELEGTGAQIEVGAVRSALPAESLHRGTAPGPVDVETEEMIQEVVARRDGGEHAAHVRPLRIATRVLGHVERRRRGRGQDRKSTRLNSSHPSNSY